MLIFNLFLKEIRAFGLLRKRINNLLNINAKMAPKIIKTSTFWRPGPVYFDFGWLFEESDFL